MMYSKSSLFPTTVLHLATLLHFFAQQPITLA